MVQFYKGVNTSKGFFIVEENVEQLCTSPLR